MTQHLHTIERFIKDESFSGVLLFLATIAAVMVANSALSDSYFALWNMALGVTLGEHTISMNLTHWINDGLMALFF